MSNTGASRSSVLSSFGSRTFNLEVMRARLPKDVFFALKHTVETGNKLQPETASVVASAMKDWALENGATHYCHWFQPMTGSTAEKHDAFFSFDSDGVPVERFSGSQLIQSEPDASSFPSGGMRSTFEARGYTGWDPTTPAFLMDGPGGVTLCVPSVFMSYHGHALDEKTPLLRSMQALSKAATRVLHLLGRTHIRRVTTALGLEQEYFLVDGKLLETRPDLLLTGRSLLGAMPAKGQQLEDHYFGTIPERVQGFMREVETELYRLGVPAKTRHNEVAPHQYELAPIHEEANIASDHNLLVMEIMRKVAARRGLALLLHEKPFAGINGSGKHNNWSMADSDGRNLLDPGKDPRSNLQFLVFLVAVLKGVHKRGALLRAAIASAANDHRLGANEAPPAIMSVFLGEQLDRILNAIESGEVTEATEEQLLHLGVSSLPAVSRDNTDRNRTSPFAFTGNKFEFRAVGSSMSVAFPNTMLNVAVAEALEDIGDELAAQLSTGMDRNAAVLSILRRESAATKAIRFEGDGYSQDWQELAAARGLPNLRTTPEALKILDDDDVRALFERLHVFTHAELEARIHIKLEQYIKQVEMEARTLASMVRTQVIPACLKHQAQLLASLNGLNSLGGLVKEILEAQLMPARKFVALTSSLITKVQELEQVTHKLHAQGDLFEIARYAQAQVLASMSSTRELADRLEGLVDASLWPMPTYRELLFQHL